MLDGMPQHRAIARRGIDFRRFLCRHARSIGKRGASSKDKWALDTTTNLCGSAKRIAAFTLQQGAMLTPRRLKAAFRWWYQAPRTNRSTRKSLTFRHVSGLTPA
jgi:hypothetical protein